MSIQKFVIVIKIKNELNPKNLQKLKNNNGKNTKKKKNYKNHIRSTVGINKCKESFRINLGMNKIPETKKRAKPEGNPMEQPCQPEENPVLPDSLTQIYILFLITFHIGPPKMHRRFHIGLPKIHRRFRTGHSKFHWRFHIGPPLLRLPSIFSCQNSTVSESWCTMAIMKEKQQNFLFEIQCSDWTSHSIPKTL